KTDATFGVSAMHGTYDPNNDLNYTILGADGWFRFGRTNVRFESLVRRQLFDTADPTRFQYELAKNGDFFVKHGAYVELEQPVTQNLDLILRGDGMYRQGNVLAQDPSAPVPADGFLGRKSSVVRGTLGAAYTLERGFMVKLSPEILQLHDREHDG